MSSAAAFLTPPALSRARRTVSRSVHSMFLTQAQRRKPDGLRRCRAEDRNRRRRQSLKESVLQIWKARKAAVSEETAIAERAAKAIQEKLDRLDEAFLFERSIEIETYDRHAEKLREELTLARMDRHSGQLDELDVEGILAFAERVLPRAADLWVQASLDRIGDVSRDHGDNGILLHHQGVRMHAYEGTSLTFVQTFAMPRTTIRGGLLANLDLTIPVVAGPSGSSFL